MTTSIFAPVDIYCERTDIGLLNEPLNAITNLSFFIAAWLLYRLYCEVYGKPNLQAKKPYFIIIASLLAVSSAAYLIFPAHGNAITIAAAVICYAYYMYRQTHAPKIEGESYLGAAKRVFTGPKREAQGLIVCIVLVGLGSLTFHTYANWLSMWLDIFPISLFVYFYLWVVLRQLLGIHWLKAAANLIIFTMLVGLIDQVPAEFRLNGSIGYLPCLLAMYSISTHLRLRGHQAANILLKAALVFAVSLTLRTMDMATCDILPIGTHFLWHILNGVVLYLLARAVIEQRPKSAN
jgi:hypothetical protein